MNGANDRLWSETKELVRRLQELDASTLSREAELGARFSFQPALAPARRLVDLFRKLPLEMLDELPSDLVRLVREAAKDVNRRLDDILAFSPDQTDAHRERVHLITQLQQAYHDAFRLIHSVIVDRAHWEGGGGGRGEAMRGKISLPREGTHTAPGGGIMRPTERSLSEQIQLHELEIARRKELLEFTQVDADLLAEAKQIILEEMNGIVEEFYEKQTSIEEIALIIGDIGTLRRLQAAQRSYITDLFSGYYDEEYVNNRLRIGLVHKRIGVEPKYYLSAVKVLKDILRVTLKKRLGDPGVLAPTLEALDKLLYFDTQLVFDTYIRSMLSELEMARDRVVRYAVELEEKVATRTQELARLSRIDSLTNLLNKRAFLEDLRREIARSRRNSVPLTLVYFDLDDFKQINDSQGHSRGDDLLRRIGKEVSALKREVDIACRYGGDEFCVVLPNTDVAGARRFVERMCDRIETNLKVKVSVGVVQTGPQDFEAVDELVEKADQAMYEMKRSRQAKAEGAGGSKTSPGSGAKRAEPGPKQRSPRRAGAGGETASRDRSGEQDAGGTA